MLCAGITGGQGGCLAWGRARTVPCMGLSSKCTGQPRRLQVSSLLFPAPLLVVWLFAVYAPLKRYLKPGMNVGIMGIGGLGHLAVQV